MDKDAKFESKDELQTWLSSRGIDEEDAGTAASALFTYGFKKQSTLLGISSDYLLRVGLDVPLAMELSNKLQQPQQQQQIPAETLAALGAMANDYLEKKGTIVLSHATNSAKIDLLEVLELTEVGASWPVKPVTIPVFPPFMWLPGDEDSPENRAAYMVHLTAHVCLSSRFAMADVQPDRSGLSVDLRGREKRRKISGTTDVVVAEVRNVQNDALRNNVEALLELKTPKNMRRKNHNPQVVCEHIAASYLNRDSAVVSVLTDLGRSWTFYWFAKVANDGPAVALYKLKLPDEDKSAGLARYILENLFDQSSPDTLPATFLDRLPFRAVQAAMIVRNGRGAGGNNDRPGNGHHNGGGNNLNEDNNQDPGSHHQNPQGPGPKNDSDGGEPPYKDGGTGTQNEMDAAEFLSLFAPPENRDIANGLELLDMVDEADQYEIVRSFAAKYIVPFVAGHES